MSQEEMTVSERWERTYQLGIVVRDLERAIEYFERAGIGPFAPGLSSEVFDRVVDGVSVSDSSVKGATAQMGPLELELLQPLSGSSLAAKHLDERGEGPVHLCAYTDRLEEESAEMRAAGFRSMASGKLTGGGRFEFFDTREFGGLSLGLYLAGAESQ